VLSKTLERSGEDRTHSRYDVTGYSLEKLEALGLLVVGEAP
jgi:hypothetical protein